MTKIGFETDLDKCITTLARAKAICKYNLDKKKCRPADCLACQQRQMIAKCEMTMPDIDKLRVQQQAGFMLGAMHNAGRGLRGVNPVTVRGKTKLAATTIVSFVSFMLMILLCMRMLVSCAPAHAAMPNRALLSSDAETHPQLWEYVEPILYYSSSNLQDLNRDGYVNCIDHMISFKIWHDMYHPGWSYRCTKVYDPYFLENEGHAFIRLYFNGRYYDIEPQGNEKKFLMQSMWPYNYNPGRVKEYMK